MMFLSKPGNMPRFRLASKVVGRAILAPSGEGGSFGQLCRRLLDEAKLPGISLYGVVGLVRCVCAVRVSSGEESLVIQPECWSGYLRDMTPGSTKVGFDHFAVHSHEDAMAMLLGLQQAARQFYGPRHAAKWSRLALYDLPLHACEYVQILNVVGGHLGTRDHGVCVRWLILRSPVRVTDVRRMAKQLTTSRGMHPQRGDGCDVQAAAEVTKAWLARLPENASAATDVASSARVQASVAWYLEHEFEEEDTSCAATDVACSECKCVLDPLARRHTLRDSGAILCAGCYKSKRRLSDHRRHTRDSPRGRGVQSEGTRDCGVERPPQRMRIELID